MSIEAKTASRPPSLQISSHPITPLYEACRDGDEEQVRNLLPKYSPVDLNRQESSCNGNTCLHIATANGHDTIVKLLLKHGCYRSSFLNSQHQSAYDIAVLNKESTHLLFLRQDDNSSSSSSKVSCLRFYEQNASECFDIVRVEDNTKDNHENLLKNEKLSTTIQTYKNEEEKKHEMEYSASSKAMCQSRFSRFCVNHLHSDEPLDHETIIKRLNILLDQINENNSGDYIKANDLMKQYEKTPNSIEHLLHLYTLETRFYTTLKKDCLPLAIPLFIHLPKLKERFFQGRVYRGMQMTYEQLSAYQMAMETAGTLLQTRLFSSTSMNRSIAEHFAHQKTKKYTNDLQVLFIYDFLHSCDQAINLSRISLNTPCLSEYEEEAEVLILPWTLFEVTHIQVATDVNDLCIINLTNIIIPNKNLLSTFKWSWVELRNQFIKEKKLKFDCAFQKYKTTVIANK